MIDVENYLLIIAGLIKTSAELISVLLVGAGVLVASYKVLQTIRRADLKKYNEARLTFSRDLVVALEFQLAADIVGTAVKPSWTGLGKLAVVAAIRTFLNFFLQREMSDEERKVKKSDEPAGG
jgi:uncharacterized membrane protein